MYVYEPKLGFCPLYHLTASQDAFVFKTAVFKSWAVTGERWDRGMADFASSGEGVRMFLVVEGFSVSHPGSGMTLSVSLFGG